MAQGVRGKANGGEFGELPAVPHWNAAQIFLVIGGEFANRRVTGSLAPDGAARASLHDRSPWAPLPGWGSAARGGICRSCAGLLPGWPLPGCASVLDAGRGPGVGEGCPRWAASTGVWRCDEEDLLAVPAHDDAWGLARNPLGGRHPRLVHTPEDGAVLRVKVHEGGML